MFLTKFIRHTKQTMTTKPQCTTQAECYRKYADWLEACKGTGVHPSGGLKYKGNIGGYLTPVFTEDPKDYEIAIGVLDGKIVWRDSVLYANSGVACPVNDIPIKLPGCWSWTPPRQTTTINGKEVAKPKLITGCSVEGNTWTIVDHATPEDAQQFRDVLK